MSRTGGRGTAACARLPAGAVAADGSETGSGAAGRKARTPGQHAQSQVGQASSCPGPELPVPASSSQQEGASRQGDACPAPTRVHRTTSVPRTFRTRDSMAWGGERLKLVERGGVAQADPSAWAWVGSGSRPTPLAHRNAMFQDWCLTPGIECTDGLVKLSHYRAWRGPRPPLAAARSSGSPPGPAAADLTPAPPLPPRRPGCGGARARSSTAPAGSASRPRPRRPWRSTRSPWGCGGPCRRRPGSRR